MQSKVLPPPSSSQTVAPPAQSQNGPEFGEPPCNHERVQPGSENASVWVDLASFTKGNYRPGRTLPMRALWYAVSLLLFESGLLPISCVKTWLLRAFGARIGAGFVIKPHVRIKYPWRLAVGDYCWIGQAAWIDNLADVEIGPHACLSQGVYLCTGSHDHRSQQFDLIVRPIRVGAGVWLGARALVLGGISIGANAVVAAGSVVTKDVPPAAIVAGNPAASIGQRHPPDPDSAALDHLRSPSEPPPS